MPPDLADDSLGAGLLDAIEALLNRFIAFPSEAARIAVALWIVHTHAVTAFDSTPRLALLSPEKGSGKTRALEVLALVVPNPLHAVNISAAALYRLVGERQPTLLLDECDTYLGVVVAKQHEELRGLINAGHRRGATVYRGEVAGKAVNVVEFPAFAACALAGIGDLPDTILDRSVVIAMKRRAPHEQLEPFRERLVRDETSALRDRIDAWSNEHADEIGNAWPEMPAGITDRAADVWEPLLAIADRAGGEWPRRARVAAVALNDARLDRDPSLGVQLLADCRRIFAAQSPDRLPTETLVQALIELDEAPWADLRGKSLDARGLARRLRRFEVRPGDHRFGDAVRKGYRADDFHDAWQRYLPSVAHVAHVAHPVGDSGANGHVAPAEAEEGSYLPSTPEGNSLSLLAEELQGQHGQQPGVDDDELERLAAKFPDLAAGATT